MKAPLAWAVVGLTAVAIILDTAFTAAHLSLLSEATWADHGWPLAPAAAAGSALMGALIASRYPRQPLGWLLSVSSLLSVTLAADAYSTWVLEGDGPGSAYWGHAVAWAGTLLGWPAFTALILIFLLSPDGHLPSRRWRWALWVTMTGLVLHTLGTLTINPGDFVNGQQYGTRAITLPLHTVGYLLVAAGLIASAVCLIVRLWHAKDDVRRQLLWIASAAAFLAFGVVCILVIPRIQGEQVTWLAGLPLRLAQVAVPLCVAIAVLRHRLVEIDLIVNRALVFTIATGVVAVGYVSVVVLVGFAVGSTGGFWPSLIATVVVAIAFQPLRRRVVRVADRLAFGAAAAPYEALADFSRRLGDSPDPAALLPAVAEAAARAVNARRVTALLHVNAGPDRLAAWPSSGSIDLRTKRLDIPVDDHGERLGCISVTMAAGHALRPADRRLMVDLAHQAGLAFRNAQLTAELSGQVEQLDLRARDLTKSRRRLITAGDAERSRLEQAIAGQVLFHLSPLPARLRELSLRGDDEGLDVASLEPLVEMLAVALEALREITRGVFPAQLARSGLPTALGSLLARTGSTGRLVVEASAVGHRFDPRIEAAAYFCVAEVAHELGGLVAVVLSEDHGQLRLLISGSDSGALPLSRMRDRVEATGGMLSLTSADGRHQVEACLPIELGEPVTVA